VVIIVVLVMGVVVVVPMVIILVVVSVPVALISVVIVPVVGMPGVPESGVITPVPCRMPDYISGMKDEPYYRPGSNVIIGGCDDGHIGPVAHVSGIGRLGVIRFNDIIPSV
jgi:hypothetical protein